jgi:hypothetical protein
MDAGRGAQRGGDKKNGQELSFYPSKSLPAWTQKLPLVFLLRIGVPRSGMDSFNPYAPYLFLHDIVIGIWKNLEIPPKQFFGSGSMVLMTRIENNLQLAKKINIYI